MNKAASLHSTILFATFYQQIRFKPEIKKTEEYLTGDVLHSILCVHLFGFSHYQKCILQLRLHLFIAAHTDQVAELNLLKCAAQLEQSGQQKRNIVNLKSQQMKYI